MIIQILLSVVAVALFVSAGIPFIYAVIPVVLIDGASLYMTLNGAS